MTCCCGGSSSSGSVGSGSVSACCNSCLRLQFPGIDFYGCDYAMFPDFAHIPAGNYRLIPTYGDANCLTNESRPELYGQNGVTEDARIYFTTSKRDSDGKQIVTAYLGCEPFIGGAAGQTPLSIATYVCDGGCQCDSIGTYSLESQVNNGGAGASWPASISIVDQATLTDPSGPPGALTVTMPDCKSTYCPATVTAVLTDTVSDNGHTFSQWSGTFSNSIFGVPNIRVDISNSCGYIAIIFRNLTFGCAACTDLSLGLYPFPASGGDAIVYLGTCEGGSGSGAFGCACPTVGVNISW